MNKKIAIISVSIIVTLFIILSGRTATSAFGQIPEETNVRTEEITENTEESGFAGTWHLAYENDHGLINEACPDYYAFGDELVIRPDGRISWHVGAAGAAGTYETYDNQLTATVSDILSERHSGHDLKTLLQIRFGHVNMRSDLAGSGNGHDVVFHISYAFADSRHPFHR